MKAKVNDLPQQAKLTLVTKENIDSKLLKTVEDSRYQIMARIVARVVFQGK